MKTENAERLGQLADTVENLVAALELPLPDELHLKGIRASLPDVVIECRSIYVDETGENPWSQSLEDISNAQLDELSDEFIGEGDSFANFNTF